MDADELYEDGEEEGLFVMDIRRLFKKTILQRRLVQQILLFSFAFESQATFLGTSDTINQKVTHQMCVDHHSCGSVDESPRHCERRKISKRLDSGSTKQEPESLLNRQVSP